MAEEGLLLTTSAPQSPLWPQRRCCGIGCQASTRLASGYHGLDGMGRPFASGEGGAEGGGAFVSIAVTLLAMQLDFLSRPAVAQWRIPCPPPPATRAQHQTGR